MVAGTPVRVAAAGSLTAAVPRCATPLHTDQTLEMSAGQGRNSGATLKGGTMTMTTMCCAAFERMGVA
jgi:hypothetical protein